VANEGWEIEPTLVIDLQFNRNLSLSFARLCIVKDGENDVEVQGRREFMVELLVNEITLGGLWLNEIRVGSPLLLHQ